MSRHLLRGAIVLAVPLVLIGNGLWLLASEWYVELLYALGLSDPGLLALTDAQRLELARAGVESIRPAGEGVEVLQAAQLPGGRPAFDPDEISHMADVRGVVRGFAIAWALGLLAALAAGAVLVLRGRRRDAVRAAALGAAVTLGAIALVGLVMLVAFDFFFEAFHGLFFAAGTWQFPADSTLLALYPYSFWTASGAAMAAIVVVQGVLVVLLARRLTRARTPRRAADAHAGAATEPRRAATR